MSSISIFLICSLLGFDGNSDRWVAQLGSARYADREEAAARLAGMGRSAVAALKVGRIARDAEIRNRSAVLLDRIESEMLVSPTLVTVDPAQISLQQALAKLGLMAEFDLEILGDSSATRGGPAIVTRTGQIPFWDALEDLATQNDLEIVAGPLPAGDGRTSGSRVGIGLSTRPSRFTPSSSSISGPFRTVLTRMVFDRELRFVGGPQGGPSRSRGEGAGVVGRRNPSSEQFLVGLRVMAEPRVDLAMNGPVQLQEVIDDRGNSLIPSKPEGSVFQGNENHLRIGGSTGNTLQMDVRLAYPLDPGKRITRFRGIIPVFVSARREDPVVINLADAKGQIVRSRDSLITVHDVRSDPDLGTLSVDLTLRRTDVANESMMGQDLMISSDSPHCQFEFLDESGKVLSKWHPSMQAMGPEGLRLTFRVMTSDGPPAQIRYYDLVRASTEAEFLFRDVPMP